MGSAKALDYQSAVNEATGKAPWRGATPLPHDLLLGLVLLLLLLSSAEFGFDPVKGDDAAVSLWFSFTHPRSFIINGLANQAYMVRTLCPLRQVSRSLGNP
jgi:hypothetical protein